jgi:cyclopropane-fatty-acyl-phospholipid synthase
VRRFDEHLVVEDAVAVNGHHYAKTARAWLANLDTRRDEALHALADHPHPARQLQRWRIFTMACEELWGWGDGSEWLVGHYRLRRADA